MKNYLKTYLQRKGHKDLECRFENADGVVFLCRDCSWLFLYDGSNIAIHGFTNIVMVDDYDDNSPSCQELIIRDIVT